jgi:hypothetical protein
MMNPEQRTDPRNNIEGYGARDWVRGGIDSREIYKNKDYNKI